MNSAGLSRLLLLVMCAVAVTACRHKSATPSPTPCKAGISESLAGELCGEIAPTCESRGYYSGEAGCTADCKVDTSACSGRCGDGVIDTLQGEQCDTTTFPPDAGCAPEDPGFPSCSRTCTLDVTTCRAAQCPVARARTLGCGRVYVWGDEWVLYDNQWPAAAAFWDAALPWLAERTDDTCPTPRGVIVASPGVTEALPAHAKELGFTVTTRSNTKLPSRDDPPGIFVLLPGHHVFTADEIAGFASWVRSGGSVLLLTSGWDQEEECTIENPILQPIGFAYSCLSPDPRGPVTTFVPGPLTRGLSSVTLPFVGGRWVLDVSDEGGSQVVANVIPRGGCPLP